MSVEGQFRRRCKGTHAAIVAPIKPKGRKKACCFQLAKLRPASPTVAMADSPNNERRKAGTKTNVMASHLMALAPQKRRDGPIHARRPWPRGSSRARASAASCSAAARRSSSSAPPSRPSLPATQVHYPLAPITTPLLLTFRIIYTILIYLSSCRFTEILSRS